MNQLMETLFTLLDLAKAKGETETNTAYKEAIQAADQRLTFDEFENLWNAITSLYQNDDLNSFILGFRLGVQLTLEGLRPIQLD